MNIQKEGKAPLRGEAGAEQLERINRLAKTSLTAEDVYVFSLRLCDNEVDRDFERFSTKALEKLGELFVGRSGLFDHQWSAEGQTARLFHTEVCRESGQVTQAGDELCYLKGWAYMLRSEKNADLIAEIEAGIKKEVSVGCSVSESVCSICGNRDGTCSHIPGREYKGKLCYRELRKPTDAYEWSFVAVPAQREAGVLQKRFGEKTKTVSLDTWKALTKEAELGRSYLQGLRREVVRLALLSDDSLSGELFGGIASKLEEEELLELKRVYEKRAQERFAPVSQLPASGERRALPQDAGEFLV